MEIRWFGSWIGKREKRDLTPAEIDQLISSKASEESLLRYQEEIASRVAHDCSHEVIKQADGYERHLEFSKMEPRRVVEVLRDVADILETSRFPTHVIHLDR